MFEPVDPGPHCRTGRYPSEMAGYRHFTASVARLHARRFGRQDVVKLQTVDLSIKHCPNFVRNFVG